MCVVALPGVSLFFLLKRRAHICTAETCMEFVFSPQCRKSINEAFLPLLLFLFVSFTGRADLGRSTQLQGAVEASPGEVTFSRGCPCLRVNPVGSAGHGCLLWLHVSAAYFGCMFQLRILAATHLQQPRWHGTLGGRATVEGHVQQLAEDTAKKVQSSSGLTLGAIQIVIFRQLVLIGRSIASNLFWPHLGRRRALQPCPMLSVVQ